MQKPLMAVLDYLILAGLKEFQLKSTVHHTPHTSNGKGQAKSNPQPPQDPVEVPIEAELRRFFYKNPHEARVSKCDWKSKSS